MGPGLSDGARVELWGDATVAWIRGTGTGIDVYDGKSVYSDDDLPADMIGAQLQFTRLFAEGGQPEHG